MIAFIFGAAVFWFLGALGPYLGVMLVLAILYGLGYAVLWPICTLIVNWQDRRAARRLRPNGVS